MQCDYTVQVARGSTVQLLLTDISMEQASQTLECIYDYISVCQVKCSKFLECSKFPSHNLTDIFSYRFMMDQMRHQN